MKIWWSRPSTALNLKAQTLGQGNILSSFKGRVIYFLWLLIAAESREADFKREFNKAYLAWKMLKWHWFEFTESFGDHFRFSWWSAWGAKTIRNWTNENCFQLKYSAGKDEKRGQIRSPEWEQNFSIWELFYFAFNFSVVTVLLLRRQTFDSRNTDFIHLFFFNATNICWVLIVPSIVLNQRFSISFCLLAQSAWDVWQCLE